MNKLFTKLTTGLVGIALAIGVGIAAGSGKDAARVSGVDDVTDVINNSATSSYLGSTATSTWATNFSITPTLNSATYYIHSMGTSGTTNALQWNGNGFLYCTNSGGTLKSVTITTTANKNIALFAQNTAYSAAPSGTALATIAATSSGVKYDFTTDYKYLALKGTTSSTSITNITIVWTPGSATTTYTVTYDANGGSGSTTGGTYDDGSTVTTKPNNFTRTNYIFDHWDTKADDSGTDYDEGDTFTISKNTTLYAQWTAESSVVFDTLNLSFTGITGTGYSGWSNKTGASGTTYKGYSAGSYSSIQLKSAESTSGIITTSSIGYVSKIKITWNDYTSTNDRSVAIFGKNTAYVNVSDLYDDDKKGTSLGNIEYTTSTVLRVTGNYKYIGLISNNGTVYLDEIKIVWSQAFNVTYDDNGSTGGSVPTDDTDYSKSASVTVLGNTGSLVKTGYHFDGWNTKDDGTGTNYAAGDTFTISEDTTLYAKWTKNSYSVGGTITGGSLSSTASVEYQNALDINIVYNEGYKLPSSITSVTMGGSAYVGYTYDASTGRFYIEHVTGDVVINATCPSRGTKRSISTTVNYGTGEWPEYVYSTETATVTITPNEHYKLPESISVSGASYTYNQSTGEIVLSSATDNITISVTCVAKNEATIKPSLTNVTADSGNPSMVEEDDTVTLKFTANDGYGLPSSVSVTGAASSSWTQATGELEITGGIAKEITFSISGAEKELLSISIDSDSGSYTLGDDFIMPTVTATFNTGSETVTSDAVASGTCLDNGILVTTGTNMNVTITYTYNNTPKTATYQATVTSKSVHGARYEKVTSTAGIVSGDKYIIVNETAAAAFNGTTDANKNKVAYETSSSYITPSSSLTPAEVTITFDSVNSRYSILNSNSKYIGRTSSDNGLEFSDSAIYNTITFDASNNAIIRGLNGNTGTYYLQYNKASNAERYRYYNNTQEKVQLYRYVGSVTKTLKWITAEVKSGTYYQGDTVTSSNFIVTAHYDDGTIETPTSDITVTNGYLSVVGSNSVTLTYGEKSCIVTVTAAERTAVYTGLSWDQGEYNIIDGQEIDFSDLGTVTAEYDDGDSSLIKPINACTVAAYTKNGDNYSKVSDLSDGDTITSTLHGKYLGVTYVEKGTSFTAYSSAALYVVESINDVYVQEEEYQWTLVNSISVGDVVLMTGTKADGTEPKELTSVDGIGNVTAFDSTPAGTYRLTVVEGKSPGTIAFKDSSNKYLSSVSDKTLSLSNDLNDSESWTISFTDNKARVINNDSKNPLQYNSSGSSRICVYASDSQQPLQFYKGTKTLVPTGDSFANTDVIGQKVALEFASYFNDTLNCTNSGETANVATKWGTVADKFEDWFVDNEKELTDDQLEYAISLFKNAYSVDGGDSLQDMLARYDYIVKKYGVSDFLNTNTDRPPVSKSVRINILAHFMNQDWNASMIIIILSGVTLLSIGGYFFLRKKKED